MKNFTDHELSVLGDALRIYRTNSLNGARLDDQTVENYLAYKKLLNEVTDEIYYRAEALDQKRES